MVINHKKLMGSKPFVIVSRLLPLCASLIGILVASGMRETETGIEKEIGRGIVTETGTERETGIDGPLDEDHDHLTSGTGDAPGLTLLLIGHHGDG